MSLKHPEPRPFSLLRPTSGISRRTVLKGATAVAASSITMPYVFSRTAAATELTFWQFYAPGGDVAPQGQWFEDMVKSWNDQNDVKIKLEHIPTSEYVSGSKLQTAFASGQGPDIFIISPGDFLRYYNGGVLRDLTPHMDKAAIDDFYPDVIATRKVDDKIFGLPMEVEPMAFYYSLDAWEEAGLSDSDIPATWEDLLGVAKTLTTGDRFGILFETGPGYYQNFTWYPFLWMGGGEIVNKDGKTSGMNSEGAIQALQLWKDTIDQGIAPRKSLGNGAGEIVSNLASDYCAIQNLGIWGISDMRVNAPDYRYGVFKLPLPPNGTYTTDLGGWAFVANEKGQDPETAAEFCVWAVGSMSDDSIQRGVDWCIKAKSDMSPRKSVLDKGTADGGYSEGAMKVFKDDIFPGGRGEPRVPPEVYKSVSDAIQACQLSDADPKQAAATAAQQIESFLASYKGAPIL
ncbi:MAG TPA: sugar ABC transporter substrate-binding protein [Thermomicrobiales bacterium]|nr:sugar ABC transporter substrate-binding protein [Thermomicrobiales bacterium]